MRICIIGPSHLAALREAEKEGLVDTSPHDITYFGHYTRIFSTLSLNGTRLRMLAARPLADDLKVEADIADYDGLFLCAVIKDASWILKRARLELADLGSFSRRLAARQLRNAIRASENFDVIAGIRAAFDGPILISTAPLRARPDVSEPVGREFDLFNAAAGEALAELGFTFVPQPSETVSAALATRREYSVGSIKLRGHEQHRQEDVSHMNSAYGALIYRAALDRLGAQA